MILRLVEKIISLLKKDPTYKIKTDYTIQQLFYFILYRVLQIIRGFIIKIKIRSSKSFIFCGRNVIIEHAYMFSCGKNLIIEDRVYINSISVNGIVIGDNVSIGKNCILIATAVIEQKGVGIMVGNNVGINAQCYFGGQGGITIGDDVIFGPGVRVFSENHNYSDSKELIRKQGVTRKGVKIESNCWIGSNTTILDGVVIAEGTIVAAGSIVTKSFPVNSLIGGVPAKLLKTRIKNPND